MHDSVGFVFGIQHESKLLPEKPELKPNITCIILGASLSTLQQDEAYHHHHFLLPGPGRQQPEMGNFSQGSWSR